MNYASKAMLLAAARNKYSAERGALLQAMPESTSCNENLRNASLLSKFLKEYEQNPSEDYVEIASIYSGMGKPLGYSAEREPDASWHRPSNHRPLSEFEQWEEQLNQRNLERETRQAEERDAQERARRKEEEAKRKEPTGWEIWNNFWGDLQRRMKNPPSEVPNDPCVENTGSFVKDQRKTWECKTRKDWH